MSESGLLQKDIALSDKEFIIVDYSDTTPLINTARVGAYYKKKMPNFCENYVLSSKSWSFMLDLFSIGFTHISAS
jgi:hypothetical protein